MSNRRAFIQNGLGFVSLGLTSPQFLRATSQGAMPKDGWAAIPTGKTLVVIEMTGGNDGLNTVVPYTDAAYAAARPNIGLKAGDVVKISDKLALHPAMKSLGAMFEKGRVAVVNGVGYPNPSRSHFQAMDIWQSGDPETQLRERSGWLGRYFDAGGPYLDTLSGIVMGAQLPLALESQNSPISLIGNGSDYDFGGADDRQKQMQVLHALYQGGTGAGANAEFVSNGGNDVYDGAETIRKALLNYDTRANSAANYPQNGLAQSLQTIAKLIAGDIGTRVFYATLGGFDTHTDQPQNHAALLRAVSESIAAFYRDLTAQGLDENVMLMTFSEFGRRVKENGAAGTDHGAANCLFLVGGSVRGGIFGDYPSLTDLDGGDLKHTTDFRRVYATVI